jgi:hypothetical protein
MIRERVTTHGTVRPLEPEPELPALHIDPSHLSSISARWAQVHLTGIHHLEKKYAGNVRSPYCAPRVRLAEERER